MKRLILLLLMAFLSLQEMYAQDEPIQFDMRIDVRLSGTGVPYRAAAGSKFKFTVVKWDGSTDESFEESLEGIGHTDPHGYIHDYPVLTNINLVRYIRVESIRTCPLIPIGCSRAEGGITIYPTYDCGFTYEANGILAGYVGQVYITIKPGSPVIKLLNPDETSFSDLDQVTVIGPRKQVATGNGNRNFYNWQFRVAPAGPWYNFPASYMGKDTVKFNATELLAGSSYNADDLIGSNIDVRLNPCSPDNFSNTIRLRVKKSAPRLESTLVTDPTCFDGFGKIRLRFHRDLVPTEIVQINLKTKADDGLINTHNVTTLEADRSFELPDELAAGKYRIIYLNVFVRDGDSLRSPLLDTVFDIVAPAAVQFSEAAKNNVLCFGNADGSVSINATGGSGAYEYMIRREVATADSLWYGFTAGSNSLIDHLAAGRYIIKVRDSRRCMAVSERTVTIFQPAPVSIAPISQEPPTFFGGSNGWIEVEVTGGTPFRDGHYPFAWSDSATGAAITSGITTSTESSGYRIRISGLPEGKYRLLVTDSNYSAARERRSCERVKVYALKQPDILHATVAIVTPVNCAGGLGGSMKITAAGGVPFTTGSPYTYTWKKQNAEGDWELLTRYTTALAANLGAGRYAINVTDSNNISLPADIIMDLTEPAILSINIIKTDVSCSTPEGDAKAIVTGGTGSYHYNWSTGETTDMISGLAVGTYMVWVTDDNGCEMHNTVEIAQPEAVQADAQITHPTCSNGNNGRIVLDVTGGKAPYSFEWIGRTETSNNLEGLTAGSYTVKITDATGCSSVHTQTLVNPAALIVDLGPDRHICSGQTVTYSLLPYVYDGEWSFQWTSDNGFTSDEPTVNLNTPGTYYAKIINGSGCESNTDTLVLISSSGSIGVEMAIPTYSVTNQKVVIVDVSNPAPDRIEWMVSPEAQVISNTQEKIELKYATAGIYDIGLKVYKGLCFAEQWKHLVINQGSTSGDPARQETTVEEFSVSPNPTLLGGTVNVRVRLSRRANISLKVVSQYNVPVYQSVQQGSDSYVVPIQATWNTPGVYILVLQVEGKPHTLKLIVL
jgi:hypothetical protein